MRYAFGEYLFDTACYELYHTGTLVSLRPKVLEVLAYLVLHRDRIVSKQELLAQLWPDHVVGEEGLNAYIMAVRQALGDRGSAPRLLRTVRGRGYRFVAPVTVGDPTGSTQQPPTPRLAITPELVASPGLMAPTLAVTDPASSGTVFPVVDEEYKLVSVLCCALTDALALAARLGPEALHRLMQAVFRLPQEVMQHYEGSITHQTSEGFTAVFGVPAAHEDHARRAVLAALELRQRLGAHAALREIIRGDSLAVGMGLDSGLVVVSGLGQDLQRPYTAVGDPLSLAMRLQRRAAPGTILLSAATYHLVHEEVRGEPCVPLDVDGRSTPVLVYALQDLLQRQAGVPGRSTRARSLFVGREWELAILHARLAHVAQGQGQAVGIAGEPGIGKSRLLAEFRRSLAGQPVLYRDGHCRPYDRSTPYVPVRDLLRQGCGLSEADGVESITAKVQRSLEEVHLRPEDEAPLLLQLLDVPVDGTRLTHLSPQERQGRTFALLRHLVRHDSQRHPLILTVENLQWIDATSEAWLTALVEHLADAAILLLVTYRPGYQPPWLAQSVATQIALPRLLPADSRAVVQAVLHSTVLSESLLQTIITKAAGNPFFLEELAWTVRDHNSHTALLGIPNTVQAVLAARLDRLRPAEKWLLQTAAVIGHEFPAALLQTVGELPAETVQQGLRLLQTAELLSETRGFPERGYTFKHALTHEVAYGSLLQERRRVLHARLVEALEALVPDRVAEQIERLAHHALRGEVWDKAVTYCQQAGARARDRAALREAVVFFELALQALAHLPEDGDTRVLAIDLRLALRSVLYPLGDYRRVLTYLHEAESLAAALDDHRRLAQVSLFLSRYFTNTGAYDQAIAAAQRALSVTTAGGEVVLHALANQRLGYVYYAQGAYGLAIDCLRQTMVAFEGARRHQRCGDVFLPAVASRVWLAWCHAELGTFVEGSALAEEGLQIAETVHHPGDLMVACRGIGLLALRQGDLPRALPRLEQAMGICQEEDFPFFFPWMAAALGAAYTLGGRVADAVPLLMQAMEQITATAMQGLQLLCSLPLGEAHLLAGRMEEAHTLAEGALGLARAHQERGHQAYALRLLGDIAAWREPLECELAEANYCQALALAEKLGMRPLMAHCHLGLGMLYRQMVRLAEARAVLSTAIELYRAMDMTFWLPQAEVALAQVEG